MEPCPGCGEAITPQQGTIEIHARFTDAEESVTVEGAYHWRCGYHALLRAVGLGYQSMIKAESYSKRQEIFRSVQPALRELERLRPAEAEPLR